MNHYLCLNLSNVSVKSVKQISKLSHFRNLKIEITPELYLSSIRDRKCISVISKFRCSRHGLAIETERRSTNIIPK